MNNLAWDYPWHYRRGIDDARKGRSPLFRRTRNGIIPTVDDPQADDWEEEKKEAYLLGYDRE